MKKIIKTLLVVMVLAIVVTAFTSCDLKDTAKGLIGKVKCTLTGEHIMEAIAEVPATCTDDGWSSGVVCSRCGYAERNSFVIPAKGHKMAPATCELPSTCTACAHTVGEALGHTPEDVEALAPTCSSKGHTAGTACSVCNKLLSAVEVDIVPTAHSYVDVAAVAPTCTKKGSTEGLGCELCGEVLFGCEEVAIDPTAHTNVIDIPATDPTCTKAGNTAGTGCTACGKVVSGYEKLDATGHVDTTTKTVDATCTTPGSETVTCSCGEVVSTKEIPATGKHVDADGDFLCDHGCETVMAPAADSVLTIEQALALGKLFEQGKYTADKYYVTGKIKNVTDTYHGNMYLVDENGNELYIYGTYSADGSTKYNALPSKPLAGDTITVYGLIGAYEAPQMKNGWVTANDHTHDFADATCETPKTCACGATEGDPIAHTFENGVCSACGTPDTSAVTYTAYTGTVSVAYGDKTYYVGAFSSDRVLVKTAAADAATITVELGNDGKSAKIKVGDTYIAPKGGNTNGIKSEEYVWSYTVNEDGSYTFSGQGSDTVSLAYNHNNGSPMIRAYKNGTLTGSSKGNYSSSFIFTPAA